MYNSSSKRRRIKPYARPTSFDYNVRFDIRQYQDVKYNRIKNPYFSMASNDECFNVMEGELLAKNNGEGARYNDKELHVFSFANGLSDGLFNEASTLSDSDELLLRANILRSIQYMGVAVTDFNPSRDVYEQGFVATIAGLNTLYNNSADTIYPGQTLCMDLPKLRQSGSNKYKRALQTGVPREKLQFVVRPLDNMKAEYGDELAKKFIIGTSISYSRPGDTVDVILHRINYTCSKSGMSSSALMTAYQLAFGDGNATMMSVAQDLAAAGLGSASSIQEIKDNASSSNRLGEVADLLQEVKNRIAGAIDDDRAISDDLEIVSKLKPPAPERAIPKKKRGSKKQ